MRRSKYKHCYSSGFDLVCHPLQFCLYDCSHSLVVKFYFGGKDKAGDGAPEGLPLIYRFSDVTNILNSISRWRTLILVILLNYSSKDHALSFPIVIGGSPPGRIKLQARLYLMTQQQAWAWGEALHPGVIVKAALRAW